MNTGTILTELKIKLSVDGITCVACGKQATERTFGGTGFCAGHLESWRAFCEPSQPTVDRYHMLYERFYAWLEGQQKPLDKPADL